MRQIMLRRNKQSQLGGKALITLPDKTIELLTVEFSREEREIYEYVNGTASLLTVTCQVIG